MNQDPVQNPTNTPANPPPSGTDSIPENDQLQAQINEAVSNLTGTPVEEKATDIEKPAISESIAPVTPETDNPVELAAPVEEVSPLEATPPPMPLAPKPEMGQEIPDELLGSMVPTITENKGAEGVQEAAPLPSVEEKQELPTSSAPSEPTLPDATTTVIASEPPANSMQDMPLAFAGGAPAVPSDVEMASPSESTPTNETPSSLPPLPSTPPTNTTSPVEETPKPKKGGGGKKVLMAVLGFFLLVGSVGAAVYYYLNAGETPQIASVGDLPKDQCKGCYNGVEIKWSNAKNQCVKTETKCGGGGGGGGGGGERCSDQSPTAAVCKGQPVGAYVMCGWNNDPDRALHCEKTSTPPDSQGNPHCAAVEKDDTGCNSGGGGGGGGGGAGECSSTDSAAGCQGKNRGDSCGNEGTCYYLENQPKGGDGKTKCTCQTTCGGESGGGCAGKDINASCDGGGSCKVDGKDGKGGYICKCKGPNCGTEPSYSFNKPPTTVSGFSKTGKLVIYFKSFLGNSYRPTIVVKDQNGTTTDVPVPALDASGRAKIVTNVSVSSGKSITISGVKDMDNNEGSDPVCAPDKNTPKMAWGWINVNGDKTCGSGLQGPPTGYVPFEKPSVSAELNWVGANMVGSPQCWADWREWPGDYDFNDFFLAYGVEASAPTVACTSIAKNKPTPKVGEDVIFHCAGQVSNFTSTQPNHYNFRYKIGSGAWTNVASAKINQANGDATIKVDRAGDWQVQCQACLKNASGAFVSCDPTTPWTAAN